MLLVCDIGNSNIVVGIWKDKELLWKFRLHTSLETTSDEYVSLLSRLIEKVSLPAQAFEGSIISSVVPPLTGEVGKAIKEITSTEPFVVSPGIRTGLNILYDDPREVGADRIVNAVAAISLLEPPVIVVDFGTATTFDVITPPANYLGGAIAPGISISMESLATRTAKLPKVETILPAKAVGRNTADSIRSGVLIGHAAMADGMIERIEKELGISAKVIATGGFAELIRNASTRINIIEPNLTLLGLRLLWEKNRAVPA